MQPHISKHIKEDFDFNKVKSNNIQNDYKLWVLNFMSIEELFEELKKFDEPADFIEFYFNKINKSRLHEILIKLISDKDLSTILSKSYKDVELNLAYVTYTLVDLDANDYKNFVIDKHKDDQDFVILCGLLVSSMELGVMSQYEDALNDDRDAYIYAISLEGPRKGGGTFTYWDYKFITDNDKFKADYDINLYDTFYDRFNEETINLLIDYLNNGNYEVFEHNTLNEDFNFGKIKGHMIEDDYKTSIDYFYSIPTIFEKKKEFDDPADFIEFALNLPGFNKDRIPELLIKLMLDNLDGFLEEIHRDVDLYQSCMTYTLTDINDDQYEKCIVNEYKNDMSFIILCGLLASGLELNIIGTFDAPLSDCACFCLSSITIDGLKKDGEYQVYWEKEFDFVSRLKRHNDELFRLYSDYFAEFALNALDEYIEKHDFDDQQSSDYDFYDDERGIYEDFDFNKIHGNDIQDEYKIDRKTIIKKIPASITPVDVLYRKYNIKPLYNEQHYSEEFGYYQCNKSMHLLNTPWSGNMQLDKDLKKAGFVELSINNIPDYIIDFVDLVILPFNKKEYPRLPFTSDNITDIIAYVAPDKGIFVLTFIKFEIGSGWAYVLKYLCNPIFAFTGELRYNDDNIKPVNEDFEFGKIKSNRVEDEYTIPLDNFQDWKHLVVAHNKSYKKQIEYVYSSIDTSKIPQYLCNIVKGYKSKPNIDIVQLSPGYTEYRMWFNFDKIREYIDDFETLLFAGLLLHTLTIHLLGEIDIAWTDPERKDDIEYYIDSAVRIENVYLRNVLLIDDCDIIIFNDWFVSKDSGDTNAEYLYDAFLDLFENITSSADEDYYDDLVKYLKEESLNEDFNFNKVKSKRLEDDYNILEAFRNLNTMKNYIDYNGIESYNKLVIDYIGEDNIWESIYKAIEPYWSFNNNDVFDYMKIVDYGERIKEYVELNTLFINLDAIDIQNEDLEDLLILGMLSYTSYIQMCGEFENEVTYEDPNWYTHAQITGIRSCSGDLTELKLFDNNNKLISQITKTNKNNPEIFKYLDASGFQSALDVYEASGCFVC